MVPPKTHAFSFLKPWASSSSTNQYSYQQFYGWGMTHPVSKAHTVGAGPGDAPQPWGSLFPDGQLAPDRKHPPRTSRGRSPRASDACAGSGPSPSV